MSTIAYVAMLVFDLIILAGCSYIVFILDRNPWWFAVAMAIIASSGFPLKRDEDKS